MAEKMTFYTLTAAGWQQMILAEIARLESERNYVRGILADKREEVAENGWEHNQIQEELEIEEQELTDKLWEQEERHHKLMGFYSDGIPF